MSITQLLKSRRYEAVATALEGKTEPKSRAQRAFSLCFLQGEEAAAELINDLPYSGVAATAHQLLARFFACRQELTQRIKIPDPAGDAWSKKYADHPSFQPSTKLSAVLIVKNEAAHIERCLKSIAPIVDEIVVIDTGSTDGTPELIKGLGLNVKMGSFAWCDDFAAARNAALELATGDWALWIDADEALEPEGFGEIRQGIIRPHFGGFFLRIVNFTGDDADTSTFTHSAYRLFQRLPGVKFQGRIHEQVVDTDHDRNLPNGNLGCATLLHYGYKPSEMASKNKQDRYLTMLEREVRDNPQSSFQWFNLANAYTIVNRLPEATHAARQSISLATDKEPFLEMAYQILSNALTLTRKPQAALEALEEAENRGLSGLIVEFARASAHLSLGNVQDAFAAIERCMQFGWEQHHMGDYAICQFKRHLLRGQILALMGRQQEAIAMFDFALEQNPGFLNAYYLKGITLANIGEHHAAIQCILPLVDEESLAPLALSALGQSYAAIGHFHLAAETFEKAWRLSPNDYDAWAAWAGACEASNDLEIVVRAYSAFAQTNEPTPEILINWGRALDRAGQPQRALDCFSEALQRAPEDPNGYFNCGDLLYRAGHYQDAAHLYEGGLRLAPENAAGWLVLGNSLMQLNLMDGARIAYREALRIEPSLSAATHNLEQIEMPAAA